MSEYTEFFLASKSNVVELELVEISHPNFSKTYRIVRNAIGGVDVTHEDGAAAHYDYYPLQITPTGASDDLDQILTVNVGDLGEVIPQELDAIVAADAGMIKPVLLYRTYRSDDLSKPLSGPVKFEIQRIPFNEDGATLEAGAPKLNQVSTGEVYSLDRFPMLQGFL